MNYKHCDPCNNFDICACCEQEMCLTCGENIDSIHINLDNGGQEELDRLIEEDMLMPSDFCRECTFYTYHDINNPDQEHYDQNLIYKVEGYVDGMKTKNFGVGGITVPMKVRNWKDRIVIIGKKPKPDFQIIPGPFILHPIGEKNENDKND